MRIAFITPEYVTEHNFDGGLANYLFRVTGALKSLGHDVEVFTLSLHDGVIIHNEILVHRVKNPRCIMSQILFLNRFKRTIDILGKSLVLKKRFMKVHENTPFDIIQAASYLSTTLLWKNISVPIVTRVSSFTPCWRAAYGNFSNLDDVICDWFEVRQMRNSCAVYAPSQLLADIISRHEPLNIDVIHPPFYIPEETQYNDQLFRDKLSGKDYLLFYGTIGRMKGINFIWENLSQILAENRNIYFVFVGKGSLPEYYDSLHSYKDRVIHFKALQHSQLVPIIKNARAVILPSIIDNLPNTCIESMYFEKTIVSTKGSSCDELIEDGKSGFIVEQKDNNQFCHVIEQVCNMSQTQLSNMGIEAHNKILQMFQGDQQINKLIRYFENIIERRSHDRPSF